MNYFKTGSPLNKNIKTTKVSEQTFEHIDVKKQLNRQMSENKSFNAAGGDTSFVSWPIYSMEVKKELAIKYSFNFSQNWNKDKEDQLHGLWGSKINIQTAATILN